MKLISLLIVFCVSLILLYRVLYVSGCKLPAINFITGKKDTFEPYPYTARDLFLVACESLAFRLFMYFISYLMLKLTYNSSEDFLSWWFKWDASNYVSIAQDGYKGIVLHDIPVLGDAYQTLVFFPLYPFFMRIINFTINNMQLSALVTSSLCYIGGCVFIYMAAAERYGNSIAKKTVILLSIFPFAFFNGAMMPESTFLLVGGACIYFTIKKRWWLAGVFGFMASLSRIQGVLLLAFMGIEWLEEYEIFLKLRNKEFKDFFKKCIYLIPMCLVPAGSFVYLLINYLNTYDWFYFLKLQKNIWSHSFADIGTALQIITNKIGENPDYFDVDIAVFIPHLIMFFLTMLVITAGIRRNRNSHLVFILIYLVISFSTDFLVSGGRYLSIAIPLFMVLGEMSERHPVLYKSMVLAFLTLQIVFMGCYLSGEHMVT